MRRILSLALMLALLAACGDGPTDPPIPSLTGRWTGTTGDIAVDLTLTETGGALSGSGHLAAPSMSLAITATGTHAHPNVSMTIRAQGYEDMDYSGTMSGDAAIVGRLNGSGFTNEGLTLNRR
jgi:hypothetical protein